MVQTVISKYRWKIGNFSEKVLENRMITLSTHFHLNDKPEAELRVAVYQGKSLRLNCENIDQVGGLKLVSKFWLECGGNKFCEHVEACVFKKSYKYAGDFMKGCNLDDLKKFIAGGSVMVCFNIILGDSVDDFYEAEAKSDAIEAERARIDAFIGNIGNLHSEGHFDLKVQAGGKEFNAFKSVLMAQSEIFKLMLSSPEFTTAEEKFINIDEIAGIEATKGTEAETDETKAKVIEALLNWMHFLNVDNLDEIACDLYKAADKYQIIALMNVCTQAMTRNLTVENLPSRTILASVYKIEELKGAILSFVEKDDKNSESLIPSYEWFVIKGSDIEFCENISAKIPEQRRK